MEKIKNEVENLMQDKGVHQLLTDEDENCKYLCYSKVKMHKKENNLKEMKNKKNFAFFLIVFIYTCVLFYKFLLMHYASDTYNIINIGYVDYAFNYSLKDGRIFMFLIGIIMNFFHVSIHFYVIFTLVAGIVISCLSVLNLKRIVEKYKYSKSLFNELIVLLISYITIFNFMYVECFYFVECIVMSLSILLIILGSEKFVDGGKKNYLISFLLLLLSFFSYQGTVFFFSSLVLLFSFFKEKNNKKIFHNFIKGLFIILIVIVLNIIFVKLMCSIFNFNQQRLGNISNIFKNLFFILKYILNIVYYCNDYFPRGLFLFYLNLLCLISGFYVLKVDRKLNHKFFWLVVLIIITVFLSFSINITVITAFFSGRLRFSLGALIGIIFIYLYCSTNIFNYRNYAISLYIILFSYLFINGITYYTNISDSKKTNYFEYIETKKINDYMKKHEKSKNDIRKIQYIYTTDKAEENGLNYDKIKHKNVMTVSALRCDWSAAGAFNFYTGRKLKCDNSVIIDNSILKKNEKYKCIDDTLYIRVYDISSKPIYKR